ncbi:MAG: glycoside hydrolase family 9 protein [Flavobacteriales bacterium]|nr:glycoside hydrolase family 9 protein [Flavobacteriales bacterium]
MLRSLPLPGLLALAFHVSAQNAPFLVVDQFGYRPLDPKVAVIRDPQAGFNAAESYTPGPLIEVRELPGRTVVWSGAPAAWNGGQTDPMSGDRGWWVDFSAVQQPGTYELHDPSTGATSDAFVVSEQVYAPILRSAMRMFYHNRCGTGKPAAFAGSAWADGLDFAGPLQDTQCRFIGDPLNAALEKDLSGGWYDAGDYNKYVTFAHGAVHDLLMAYEEYPQAFGDDSGIPESGNGVPDILDEVKWELDWLLKMVGPDGSVHIKMGSQNFSENVLAPPSANTDPRFYGPVCSSATLAAAAMFAHAARVFGGVPAYAMFAQQLQAQAEACWTQVQPQLMNNTLDTDCDDGSIVAGDADRSVPEQWALAFETAVHLFRATGDADHAQFIADHYQDMTPLVNDLWYTYDLPVIDALLDYAALTDADPVVAADIRASFTTDATNNWLFYYGGVEDDLYRAYMPAWSYHWGSNIPKAGYGLLNLLLVRNAILPANDDLYREYALAALNGFHGVNPLTLVYLSNMGALGAERSCDQIYHTWFADGTDWDDAQSSLHGPPPGYVPGGPNAAFSVTSLSPPAGQPEQKSYLDFNDGWPNNSWEVSEPAIYSQAAYVRLLAHFVDLSLTTGVQEPPAERTLVLWPNPAGDRAWVEPAGEGPWQVTLRDAAGRSLRGMQLQVAGPIDLGGLAAGCYVVEVVGQRAERVSGRLIVQ